MDYIDRMIGIRNDHDETQTELALALGWSRPQIARYETRRCVPPMDYLEAFCRHYRISADYLLELSYHKPRKKK